MNVPLEVLWLYAVALDLAFVAGTVLSARELGWVVVDVVSVEVHEINNVISIHCRRGK